MTPYDPTDRTKVRRLADRGSYDEDVVHKILDEAPIVHVGFAAEGQPYVLPMIHGRVGSRLYLHGAAGGRNLRALSSGAPLCATATVLDGLVLARSAFHHSMNYRCVVVLGAGAAVNDPVEKIEALEAITERLIPGRWAGVAPTRAAFGKLVPDPRLKPGTPVPDYLKSLIGR